MRKRTFLTTSPVSASFISTQGRFQLVLSGNLRDLLLLCSWILYPPRLRPNLQMHSPTIACRPASLPLPRGQTYRVQTYSDHRPYSRSPCLPPSLPPSLGHHCSRPKFGRAEEHLLSQRCQAGREGERERERENERERERHHVSIGDGG